ncbi:hypothetical protein HK099_003883 [Clydaea vesicula]|uniref:Uncharacterized protein n=1 Tax=Clydaea vesicula TaxID=447962 RepID=A0AAD5U186_9FUNG|nr:hypothetical protein HK099_003883 [Clydaea vesicula]
MRFCLRNIKKNLIPKSKVKNSYLKFSSTNLKFNISNPTISISMQSDQINALSNSLVIPTNSRLQVLTVRGQALSMVWASSSVDDMRGPKPRKDEVFEDYLRQNLTEEEKNMSNHSSSTSSLILNPADFDLDQRQEIKITSNHHRVLSSNSLADEKNSFNYSNLNLSDLLWYMEKEEVAFNVFDNLEFNLNTNFIKDEIFYKLFDILFESKTIVTFIPLFPSSEVEEFTQHVLESRNDIIRELLYEQALYRCPKCYLYAIFLEVPRKYFLTKESLIKLSDLSLLELEKRKKKIDIETLQTKIILNCISLTYYVTFSYVKAILLEFDTGVKDLNLSLNDKRSRRLIWSNLLFYSIFYSIYWNENFISEEDHLEMLNEEEWLKLGRFCVSRR